MEKDKPAPSYHSNVVSGEKLRKLLTGGWYRGTAIYQFGMTWDCGHTGNAVDLFSGDMKQGSIKACEACMRQFGA